MVTSFLVLALSTAAAADPVPPEPKGVEVVFMAQSVVLDPEKQVATARGITATPAVVRWRLHGEVVEVSGVRIVWSLKAQTVEVEGPGALRLPVPR
jgi:hypothetical protein